MRGSGEAPSEGPAEAASALSGHQRPRQWAPASATTCLRGMPSLAAKARRSRACAAQTAAEEEEEDDDEARPPLPLRRTEEDPPPPFPAPAAAEASLAALLGSNSLPSGAYAQESLLPGSKPNTGPPAPSTTTAAASWITSASDSLGAAASAIGLSHSTTSARPSLPGCESSCLVLLCFFFVFEEKERVLWVRSPSSPDFL